MNGGDRSFPNRRQFVQTVGAGTALGLAGCLGGSGGSTDTVKIASNVPLSGPWATVGQLANQGAKFAAKKINDDGGIEALDGAEIEIVDSDAGESADAATSAIQDAISEHDLTAISGSWLSSFTLGTSSVAEREQIPMLTLSYADDITDRDHDYIFRPSPRSSEFATLGLESLLAMADNVGAEINDVAFVGDNTAASEAFFPGMREAVESEGMNIVMEEIWTPPLSDSTPVVREIENTDPDFIMWSATSTEDAISNINKMNERDVNVPMMGQGTWLSNPPFLESLGSDLVMDLMGMVGSHQTAPLVDQGLIGEWTDWSGEPYMTSDAANDVAHIYLVAEACEQAGSADPQDVRDELTSLQLDDPTYPGVAPLATDYVEFDENGDLTDPEVLIYQWQESSDMDHVGTESAPLTVTPENLAESEVNWPQ